MSDLPVGWTRVSLDHDDLLTWIPVKAGEGEFELVLPDKAARTLESAYKLWTDIQALTWQYVAHARKHRELYGEEWQPDSPYLK